ncbi:MAG: S8 family serine peptidase [Verrucomicrobia bacterium]|nr:S8 family serine peptidase [Verrucomicrobiota bacterium]
MKPRCFARRASSILLLALGFTFTALAAPTKAIHLRNETITPELATSQTVQTVQAAAPTAESPVNGLFLIQFHGTVSAVAREQLRAFGVEFLQYVPDDAFVVKFTNARPGIIRQFDLVRWLGPYRPEYKIHRILTNSPAVATNAPGGAFSSLAAADSLDIAVLLSPRATPAEREQTKRLFGRLRPESSNPFGRVLRGRLDRAQLNTLASSDAVLWIEPAPVMRMFDEVASRIVDGDGPPGQTLVQSLGYTGAGVTVAVADSGLDSGDTNSMHPDIQGRVKALFYYGAPGQLEDAADEHSHGTHCAGIIAGNGAVGETDENNFLYGLGVAPGASLVAQRIFDAAGGYAAPPTYETLTRDAKRAGADIGSNSWGDDTQGRYDLSAMEFDGLVRDADALALGDQPYILEFSAGNAGPAARTIGSPAVGKNVIATGAANNDRHNLPLEEFAIYDTGTETMADFSSRGPCEDGRIKPDLVAPGSWIASLRSVYANDDFAWWPISDNYLYQGGTSQAGPHVSGTAAVFVQFYRATHGNATPSPALVKAALINSATDMDDSVETGPVPNNDEGWGRLNLPALIASPHDHYFLDQTVLLTNSAVYEQRMLIADANEPLKITLAYTDVPGNPAAVIALVNDLDLEVVSPGGQVYRGNRFDFGESIPDAAGADTINNVEAVHLYAPVPGEYLIRVHASRIVEDARRDTPALDQDFALVVSGTFGTPGVGIVTFNRQIYRAPDQIRLSLVDYDLAGQPSPQVLLRSTLEPLGENVTLLASGVTGLFTGVVATATGPATADGKLQLAHGNLIEVVYADASPASTRVFTALADLLPPVISNVQAANQFGEVIVSWTTDEEAHSVLYYGTNTLNFALTNSSLDVTHDFALLGGLPPGVIHFMAVAEDAAGNRATNNNGGAFFNFTNTQPPEILLLDSYTDNGGFIAAPPLSGYTDALAALGRAYNVFDASTGAEPTLAQLQAYRCVVWRMDEISTPAVSLAQKIASYVTNGGALFIASMDATSRFTEAGLASFNTDVLQLQSYTEDQPVNAIAGTTTDPVGAGMDTALDYSPYDELLSFLAFLGVTDPSDWIVPTPKATAILLSDGSVVGVRSPKTGVDLPARVVYLSFPLDAVPLGSGVGNNRAGLLNNILNFLVPTAGSSSLTLDSDVYSVPGRAVVEVEDIDLQNLGQTTITVHSPQQTNGVPITLLETARHGLFRGSFILTPTNTAAAGTLHVAANDTIQADYFDASASHLITATATIETNAPVISDVLIEPGYLEAVVNWVTSEDTDALVQYSESRDSFPNNFTTYDPTLASYHSLFLSGLKPNTTYYARLVSRDRAGNSTTEDNGGQLYTFTTLQPITPPWYDNIETNNANWSTITPPESETQWTRGGPGNGETAHSPTDCWGANLTGATLSQSETYLVSPGILLAGGNQATLRFWHNYDFLSGGEGDIELAAVQIITNTATSPVVLWQLPADSSFGWEEVELDLTPHLGKVVYIVWYYFLFSFEAPPRMGWLVDDVSITVTNVQSGTVQITNNLWQAFYVLTGPTNRTAGGRSEILSTAPPGQYVIQYADLPYYQTPPPQTNLLAPGGSVTFTGNYTFADLNSNAIPDGWEVQQFGTLTAQRTPTTDTDGDGLSDWAEFVAGTDPNNPPPPFRLTAQRFGGNFVQLSWPSVTNHSYRIHASSNAVSWSPFSDWFSAMAPNTSYLLATTTNGAAKFFRVEAAPPSSAVAATFRVSAILLPNRQVHLEWPSAPGHGYRILGSTNASSWSPFSDWLRASGFTTGFTLPARTNSAPSLFRVEAQP